MKIPFQLTAAVSIPERYANMLSAIGRGLPRLQQVPIEEGKSLSVACYGPSLRDTWRDLKKPIISMSGATHFLAERGIIPDWHVDMDPRPHKVKHITPPVPGVTYLLSSVCHPSYFDTLKDERVVLWHSVSSGMEADLGWLAQHDPGELIVSTGSNMGLGAIQVGGLLGFRHFEIHGMDGSFVDGKRHAGEHLGMVQNPNQVWKAGGKPYYTSKIMANGVAETINIVGNFPIFCVFHGDGLTQALIKEANLKNACLASDERVDEVRKSAAFFVDIASSKEQFYSTSAWEVFYTPKPEWIQELQDAFAEAESRRRIAKFNTGSISLETGLLLRSLCEWRKPRVIVEIGTFIGKSTAALKGEVIYTCDKDNDCLTGSDTVRVHPYQTSNQMLTKLVDEGVKADMFFFDGRLKDEDIELVLRLSTPKTIYTFDDFNEGGKGMANVAKLAPFLKSYGFMEPYSVFAGRTTLAAMVPTQ